MQRGKDDKRVRNARPGQGPEVADGADAPANRPAGADRAGPRDAAATPPRDPDSDPDGAAADETEDRPEDQTDWLTVSPFLALPPLIVVLAVVIGGIEVLFQLGAAGLVGDAQAIGWRVTAITRYGFSPPLWQHMLAVGVVPLEGVTRFLSYPFLHVNATHALFGVVLLLALGKFASHHFRWWEMALVMAAAAVLGAAGYGALVETRVALIGIYPAVYGLIGMFTQVHFSGAAAGTRGRVLAFRLVLVLIAMQILVRLLFGGGVEWVADGIGFLVGFGLSFWLGPSGRARLARLRACLQQR